PSGAGDGSHRDGWCPRLPGGRAVGRHPGDRGASRRAPHRPGRRLRDWGPAGLRVDPPPTRSDRTRSGARLRAHRLIPGGRKVIGVRTNAEEATMPDKGPGSKSAPKKPKGGTKAGGGKKKK